MRVGAYAKWVIAVSIAAIPASRVIAGTGVIGFTVVGGPGLGNGLFATVGASTSQPGLTTWPVTVDVGALSSLPSGFLLNLPSRSSVTLSRDNSEIRGPNAFLWTGRGGDCNVVLDNNPAGLSGEFSCANANYELTGTPSSLQLNRYDANPAGPPPGREDDAPEDIVPLEALQNSQPPNRPDTPPDTTIDVLVLYQEAVRAALDPFGGSLHTAAFAQLCVDTLQQAMVASTTPGQATIATVHMVAVKKVSRTVYGSATADLAWLQGNSEPMNLRNFWAADVVVYLTFNGGTDYGISVIPGSTNPPNPQFPPPGPAYAPLAEAVVQYNTAIQDTTHGNPAEPYVFMHEFAHIVGANHNFEDARNNTTPLQPWAYGHWAVNAKNGSERTIVSNATPQCLAGGDCTRILYYSNPGVRADWFRTGVTGTADNALIISTYGTYTAQYRTSLTRIFYDGFDDHQ